jgi:XTP/dITP diphosphohydrolase
LADPVADPLADPLADFRDVMRRLRVECAWKREQTHESLRQYLVEESWETLEAIDTGDLDHLCEELGDLLLQIGFHAVIAEESGAFTFDDVVLGIIDKLRRRNPHVFGDAPVTDAASVNELWQSVKATEKPRTSIFDGIPAGLPALLLADKVLDRAERAGTPVDLPVDAGIGDRLLLLVAEARAAGVDPEHALRDAVRRVAPA